MCGQSAIDPYDDIHVYINIIKCIHICRHLYYTLYINIYTKRDYMNSRWLTIKQLDQQLQEWQAVSKKYGVPRAGWVKTVRTALSMSAEQLANRLGLTRSRITQLENAEIHDAVTLRTLKDAANAMGCEFVYAIVPKNQMTLEDIIRKRAEQIAKERVTRTAHSMSLEAQSVGTYILKKQKDDLTESLMKHLNKKFWLTPDSSDKNNSKSIRFKKLIKNLQKKK